MKRKAVVWLAACWTASVLAEGETSMIKGYFTDQGTGLCHVADGWSVRSEDDRGWVSLRIRDGEFLHATPSRGGLAFLLGNRWCTRFPCHDNVTHDDSLGRVGYIADGINMARITAAKGKPEAELYLGANEKQDQAVRLFLSDDVVSIRSADAEWTPESKSSIASREFAIRHRNGAVLTVRAPTNAPELEAGAMADPAGGRRPCVSFACKGFAANAYALAFDTGIAASTGKTARLADSVSGARFDVKSSDDPPKGNLFGGAASGACNPIYGPDTKVDFGMLFKWAGERPFNGYAELEITHSLGQRHFYQKVELADVTNKEVRVQFQPVFHLPGVSEVWCRLVDADGWLAWVGRYRMAWDWERYRPGIRVEPDFKAFWDATLAELRATPLAPQATRIFEDHAGFEMYDVTLNGWQKQRLHAMLFVPKGLQRPAAAIVTAHPGTTGFGVNRRSDGTYGSELKQRTNVVTIVPLIRGHAPDASDIPFNHPWWGPLDDRDAYVARAWYCAMARAVDYLATRPDLVDMKRVIASGGSQGGALALITAALDPRVAVCLSDCPANCQPHEILENYASFGPTKGQVPEGQTLEQLERMLSYYNPVNFCPLIRCPTYVGSNIGDLTVHSMGPLAAYHNLAALKPEEKAFYPGFTHAHGSGPGLGQRTQQVIEEMTRK